MSQYQTSSSAEFDAVSKIQTLFIVVTLILMTAFYSVGCLEKSDPTVSTAVKTMAGVEDNQGISKLLNEYFGDTLGQIIAVENYYQTSAQAVVTLTMPSPDVAKVYIIKQNGEWVVERVEKGYDQSSE